MSSSLLSEVAVSAYEGQAEPIRPLDLRTKNFQVDKGQESLTRNFQIDAQPAGHDNSNYVVGARQHRFSREIHTKVAAIYMWQCGAIVGGTQIIGPSQLFASERKRGELPPRMSTT